VSKVLPYAIFVLPKVYKLGPAWFRRLAVNLFPSPDVHELRDIIDLMQSTSVEIYNSKKKALEEGDDAIKQHIAQGKDVISVLSESENVVALRLADNVLSSEGEYEGNGRG
jgi:hypothetical protein